MWVKLQHFLHVRYWDFDVFICGAGSAGLSCAYELSKNPNVQGLRSCRREVMDNKNVDDDYARSRKLPAGIWANAHGEVGRVLRHCSDELQVYGRFKVFRFGEITEMVLVVLIRVLAELVPELWNLDKLGFNVILFDKNLLPDPAFLCGF
nr:thiamine thiazole synthase, chloroplastic [Tanacetum cinerariifolium]